MPGDGRPTERRHHALRFGGRSARGANPLEREVDVVERRRHRIVIAIAMILLPLAVIPGILVWASQDDGPRPVVNTVSATTDADARPVAPISSSLGDDDANKVPAHWLWKGNPISGRVAVPPGTEAGSSLLLPVDHTGQPTPPVPLRADGSVTGVAMIVVLVGLVVAMYLAMRNWIAVNCDRRRMLMWDRDIERFFA